MTSPFERTLTMISPRGRCLSFPSVDAGTETFKSSSAFENCHVTMKKMSNKKTISIIGAI